MPRKNVSNPLFSYAFATPARARAAYARLSRYSSQFHCFPAFGVSHASIVTPCSFPPILWERAGLIPPPETSLAPPLPF